MRSKSLRTSSIKRLLYSIHSFHASAYVLMQSTLTLHQNNQFIYVFKCVPCVGVMRRFQEGFMFNVGSSQDECENY